MLTLRHLFLSRLHCVDGVRVWLLRPSGLLVRQIPYREISGAESRYPPWESLALSCAVWFLWGSSRFAVGPFRP